MLAADTNVSPRCLAAAALLSGALLALAAAPAARAQDGPPLPVTPPLEPVTPTPAPVTPPADTVTPATASAPFGTSAVVLVGGFNSSSPFSTPACATTGRGPTWGNATGPAASLDGAGLPVFTAPIANAGTPVAASCLGGRSTPDIPADGSTVIDSNGELAANQAALVAFLRFLNDSYGITSVALVGHSDGGLWSRAAISQLRGGGSPVTVTSLTTVGTPHTGSFGADLMVALVNAGGSCANLSGWEQLACELAEDAVEAVYQNLGMDVIEELTSSWLGGWNPTTSIGCPVTVLGGNHVGVDVGIGTYYTANDGIVGQASALNQGTWLPAVDAAPFTPVGPSNGAPQLYDVVHSESLTFLSPNTELNSADVGSAVLASVQSPPAGACAAASTSALRARSSDEPARTTATAARVAAARGARLDTVIALHHRAGATRGGTLPRPRHGDAIVLFGAATARCGGREVPATPLLGSRDVKVASVTCDRPLRVTGRGLHLARSGAHVRLTREGRTLRWRTAGAKLRHVRAHLRVDGRWRPVSGHRLTVPAASKDPALRVRGVDARGRVVRGHARIPG